MEERFNAKMKALYGKYSTHDVGDGSRSDQPFIEIKPDNNDREKLSNDSFSLPIGSTARDLTRIGGFLKSSHGLLFLAKQVLLQTGNAIVETRVVNPFFVIGNVVPYLHLSRNISSPKDFTPSGDQTQKSPASDASIGSAGRMQTGTANAATATATGNGGSNGLLSLLSPSKLVNTVTGIYSLTQGGALGINQRPELNVSGEFYSILLWKGFQKQSNVASNLNQVSANLRVGNIKGALNSLGNIVSNLNQTTIGITAPLLAASGRDAPTTDIDGRRYFIIDQDNADRYLKDSVSAWYNADGKQVPNVIMPYLYDLPYILGGQNETNSTPSVASGFGVNISKAAATTASPSSFSAQLGAAAKTIKQFSDNAATSARQAIDTSGQPLFDTLLAAQTSIPFDATATDDNSAEDNMLFSQLSLRNRYLQDSRLDFIRTQLAAQVANQTTYWQTVQTLPKSGIVSGQYNAGDILNIDPRVRQPAPHTVDNLNLIDIDSLKNSGNVISQAVLDQIASYGQDYINVFFYDFVNKKTIPMRAFISDINESVKSQMNDTQYIGRLERNVVYTGVIRELSFTLRVHAFSKPEMGRIWKKINYITGLCYPAQYAEGFIVPPLVKLTIGDLYRDQPGYISSLTNHVDDDVSWETETGYQAPHGITMNISFTVIEKQQMQTNSVFYPFGQARITAPITSNADGFTNTDSSVFDV